jgi:hypothetical protein
MYEHLLPGGALPAPQVPPLPARRSGVVEQVKSVETAVTVSPVADQAPTGSCSVTRQEESSENAKPGTGVCGCTTVQDCWDTCCEGAVNALRQVNHQCRCQWQ